MEFTAKIRRKRLLESQTLHPSMICPTFCWARCSGWQAEAQGKPAGCSCPLIVLVSAIHAHNLLAPVPVLKHSQRQSPACAALLTGPAVLLCLLCPPPRCSPAITLTCRRFQRLFYAESSLWRQCRVAPPEGFSSLAPADQEAWATAQAARLARVDRKSVV